MTVATSPTWIEVTTASRTPVLLATSRHQWVVRLRGGQAKTWLALKELTTTTRSGR